MIKKISSLLYLHIFFLSAFTQEKFQLAPPFMKYSSVFFTQQATVTLLFAQPETVIRYTVSGEDPTELSQPYNGSFTISKNFTTVKAKVFGKDFSPSETVQATFVKDGLPLKKIDIPVPNERYAGEGANTLLDHKGGIAAYESNTWLGFKQDTVSLTISLDKKRKIRSVLFNLLQDQGSWIFFPEKVEAYIAGKKNNGSIKLGEMNFKPEENKDISVCKPFLIHFKKKIKTDTIELKLFLLKSIPDWHPGKKQSSWIFIDEVKIY